MRTLTLFGPPALEGGRLSFASSRAAELLAYLAHRGPSPVARAEAALALWPSLDPERARHNLRQTLVYLREGLAAVGADGLLRADRANVGLDAAAADTDVWRLRALAPRTDDGALVEIDATARGSFAQGIEAEWLEPARETYARIHRNALIRLAAGTLVPCPERSLEYARRAAEIDPLREDATVAWVEALRALGERAEATRVAQSYTARVRGELGIAPGPRLGAALETVDGEEPPADDLIQALGPLARLRLQIDLAPAYLARGRSQVGLRALQDALDAAPEASLGDRARAHAWLGRHRYALDDGAGASAAIEEALRLAPDPSARGAILPTHIHVLLLSGRTEDARSAIGESLRIARRLGDPELRAEAAQLLGLIDWNDLERYPHEANRALRLARQTRNPPLVVRALGMVAQARFLQGDRGGAREAYAEAIETASTHGLAIYRAYYETALGRTLEDEGQLDRARDLYLRALVTLEGAESRRTLVQAITYLADADLRAGDAVAAAKGHARALAYRRVSGDLLGLATSLRGLGKALAARGERGSAREALLEARRLYLSLDRAVEAATVRAPLAWLLLQEGRRSEARAEVHRLLRDLEDVPLALRHAAVSDGSLDPERLDALRAAVEGTVAAKPS